MSKQASDLFIVDNSDADWKVRSYLKDWCELSSAIDIATGYFEIGALLALEEKWQAVDHLRILMGDEVSLRTKRAFAQSIKKINDRLDSSLESEKSQNDFLQGVPAIVDAIRSGKIQCRVFRKDKFHAKAYLTHGRAAVIGSFGLVGSSNFTYPGLTDNVELNVQIRGPEVGLLQEWYERHWNEAEDVAPDLLRTLERHTREYSPFEVWVKALDELMRGHELTPDEWDRGQSKVFPILAKYQQDAYKNLIQIADRFGTALLCDGVGLGKTFVGLMLLERMVVREGRRVVLFAPKAAREDVWERAIQRYLPHLNSGFVNFVLYNHTDLQRKGRWPRDIELTLRDADVVLIDEAHHFRNPGIKGEGAKEASRYRLLQQYLQSTGRPKQLFMLTATPVNNSIHDFRHMIELAGNETIFATQLGIHNLRSHFNQLEKHLLGKNPATSQLDLEFGTEIFAAEQALRTDRIFDAIVVQRSRGYVKESQRQQGANEALFPEREAPKVIAYNLKATYGKLLTAVEIAFNKKTPLFVLGIYYPLSYWKGDKTDPLLGSFDVGRQKQVVTLIRTLFLKRFESSPRRPVMRHMEVATGNLGLHICRQLSSPTWQHVLVTRGLTDDCYVSNRTKERGYTIPLYLIQAPGELDLGQKTPNINVYLYDGIVPEEQVDRIPEMVFFYVYAVLYSAVYRVRYIDFLKRDFPRVPLTRDLKMFRALTQLGGELVALHLLESPKLNGFITRFEGTGDTSIPKKPTWKDGAVWINASQRFEGVPEAVWNFHIGGYQVCEKWLKDRKGRTLTVEDIAHYQRIVVALNETIRLMAEIDRVIEAHGGWPQAFQVSPNEALA